MDMKAYFRGVGVGLIIAWVTGALAYYKAGVSVFPTIIEFEVVVSIIMLVTGLLIKNKKR